jgi:hypothetical protein
MKQYIKQLYKYLEVHEAKEEFLAAFAKEEPNISLLDYYTRLETNPTNMITGAFIWGRTPSGSSYWSKLDDKWREQVKLIALSN